MVTGKYPRPFRAGAEFPFYLSVCIFWLTLSNDNNNTSLLNITRPDEVSLNQKNMTVRYVFKQHVCDLLSSLDNMIASICSTPSWLLRYVLFPE